MKKVSIFLMLSFLTSCEIRYVVSSNFVKEFCSCLFVVKRGEKLCFDQAKQFIKPSSYSIDKEKLTITSSFLGASSSVKYLSEKYGCQLE